MTGPEHFQEAGRYTEASVYAYQKWGESGKAGDLKAALWQQAQAQVHATLAQTAIVALAEGVKAGAVAINRVRPWLEAIGIYETGEGES